MPQTLPRSSSGPGCVIFDSWLLMRLRNIRRQTCGACGGRADATKAGLVAMELKVHKYHGSSVPGPVDLSGSLAGHTHQFS